MQIVDNAIKGSTKNNPSVNTSNSEMSEIKYTSEPIMPTVIAVTPSVAMQIVFCIDFPCIYIKDLDKTAQVPTTAIFYTIWSYKSGKGQELLFQAVKGIQEQYPSVTRFVTLSPKTNMARRFHLKNGAIVFRENLDTTNYEYTVEKETLKTEEK